MESRKQNKDDRTVVLALPAPGSSDFRPPRRRSVVPRKKKNSAQHKEEASSSNPIATGAPAATTGTSDLNLQAEDINQSQMRIVEESIGITDLQESTTVLHGGAQIMGEATDIGQQADAVNNFQENQVDPIGFNQQQPDIANVGPQIPEQAAGFNQQQPDLANVGPQIPEQAAANPNEDMNDMFEFALNNSILDLDSLETTP